MIILKTPAEEIYWNSLIIISSFFSCLIPIFTENFYIPFIFFGIILVSKSQIHTRRSIARQIFNSKELNDLVTDDVKEKVKEFVEDEFQFRIKYREERIERLKDEINNLYNEISKTKMIIKKLNEDKESVLLQFEDKSKIE